MDIYIKSFNRPYLLDHSLSSIYHFLKNYNQIIVLDDGTPQKYIEKLQLKYPEVSFRFSPFAAKKQKAISENKTPEKIIPIDFWKEEILKGSDYFILIEDDMWFTESLDLECLKKEMQKESMDLVKMMWIKNTELISNNIIKSNNLFSIIKPKLLINNPKWFRAVFLENKWKSYSILKRLGVNMPKNHLAYYHLFIVAGGAFSKRFYRIAWENPQKEVDECRQIAQVMKAKKQMNFGHYNKEIIKATYKTTASSANKDHLGVDLDIFTLNHLLNTSWFNNTGFTLTNYQENIPNSWIKECLESPENHFNISFSDWEKWYDAFRESYRLINCDID